MYPCVQRIYFVSQQSVGCVLVFLFSDVLFCQKALKLGQHEFEMAPVKYKTSCLTQEELNPPPPQAILSCEYEPPVGNVNIF